MKEENSSETDDDEASRIPCERERAMDVNGSGSANAAEDIGMKKTMDSNEELETKKGQSYTTCGSSINSSSSSACHTSQPRISLLNPLPLTRKHLITTRNVEVHTLLPLTPTQLVNSNNGKHPNLILIVGIGAGMLIIAIIVVLIICSCSSRRGNKKASAKETDIF